MYIENGLDMYNMYNIYDSGFHIPPPFFSYPALAGVPFPPVFLPPANKTPLMLTPEIPLTLIPEVPLTFIPKVRSTLTPATGTIEHLRQILVNLVN